MALSSPVLESSVRGGDNVNSITTASFTPTANSVLFAIGNETIKFSGDYTGDTDITDSLSSTWTLVASKSSSPLGYSANMNVWYTIIGGSPSAMTVTLTNNQGSLNSYGSGLDLVSFTGYDTGDIIGLAESFNRGTGYPNNTTGDGAWSLTLAGSPASDSYLVACIESDSVSAAGIVTGTGWTNVNNPGNHPAAQAVQARTGTTSQAVDWNDTADASGAYYNIAIVFEVKAAAGGGGGGTFAPRLSLLGVGR